MNTLPWEAGAIARGVLAGAIARAAGVPRERNPYSGRTVSAAAWERGWDHEDRQLGAEAAGMNAGDGLGKEEKARA